MNNNFYEPFDRNTDIDNFSENGRTPEYRAEPQQTEYGQGTGYTPHNIGYASEPVNSNSFGASPAHETKGRKKKKAKKPAGAIAAVVAVCIMLSGIAGFGGSYLFSKLNTQPESSSAVQINKANVDKNVTKTSAEQADKSTKEIVSEVADSVVEIKVEIVESNPFYGESAAEGAGSGVIISEDGYILTNNHVVDGASKITVTLRSGESHEAQLIGTDPDVDIALIKIEASGLSAAKIGDSSAVKAGDKAVIIGNPLGTLGGSVTEGIISATDRTLEIDGKTMHLMQTDAAVNPGNSGGGMFNGQGELAGIVVAKSSDSTIDNIGFVIPINNALDILGDLKEYGYVRGKASTGMAFSEGSNQSNQMYSQFFGYGEMTDTGVYVASVKSGSNAEKAGFNAGDRVISVDGTEVKSISDLKAIISGHSVGDTLSFELERNGSTGTLQLTLEEYAPSATA